jgi:superfamily II RNA helicase
MGYEGYLSDRELISRDAFHKKQLKIKVIEVNENTRDYSKYGDRILIDKILLIIQNLETDVIEERELDIEDLEKKMKKERLFTSSNRWVPRSDIRNNFIVGNRHFFLLSDAISLDIIKF